MQPVGDGHAQTDAARVHIVTADLEKFIRGVFVPPPGCPHYFLVARHGASLTFNCADCGAHVSELTVARRPREHQVICKIEEGAA